MGELDGKVAVITGAGSGMGRASAAVFVREGAKVFAVDISGGEATTAAALGEAVVPFRCDMTDEAAVEAMFAAALASFGKVDAMLNVAGVAAGGMLADAPLEEYERIMGVNLKGVMLGTKHAIRTMVPNGGGTITNWSSTGGLNASPGTSIYSMSKAGVIALTKAAAIEYGVQGIRANTICPGFIETEMSGGPGSRCPLPADDRAQRPPTGRPTGRGRRGRQLPRLRSGEPDDRCRHRGRRRHVRTHGLTAGVRHVRHRLARRVLRPVRPGDQRRSVSDVRPPPRRSTGLPQRALRVLGPVASRRRREGIRRLADVRELSRRHPRDHQVGGRPAVGDRHVRGPTGAHHAPRADVSGLHTAADGRARGPVCARSA